MTTSPTPEPEAGWYADPEVPGGSRYWDGGAWTENRQAPPPSAAARKGLSTGAIVAIVVGSFVMFGMVVAALMPMLFSHSGKAEDDAALADAKLLGREIAFYYVDGSGPAPTIVEQGDTYVLRFEGAIAEIPRSANVYVGSAEGSGATDWCVSVFNPEGDVKSFRYSAAGGLEQGSC